MSICSCNLKPPDSARYLFTNSGFRHIVAQLPPIVGGTNFANGHGKAEHFVRRCWHLCCELRESQQLALVTHPTSAEATLVAEQLRSSYPTAHFHYNINFLYYHLQPCGPPDNLRDLGRFIHPISWTSRVTSGAVLSTCASLLPTPMSGASSPAAAAAAPGASATLDQQSTRDSFIPLFDGTPSGYQEWRKRITIYSKKMELMKRTGEAALNLLGSLQGTAWKLVEDYDLEKADKPGAFAEILMRLDKAFKYDSKAEMPADFAAYFEHGGRKANQTLLQFITDHDDKLRKIEKHGVSLPKEVQGYQLLSKANITKEQKQLIMTHAKSLERDKIQEALFTILGQDYRSSSGFPPSRWSS